MNDKTLTLLSKEDQALLGDLGQEKISPRVFQHAEHPRNRGAIHQPDGEAEVTGICEDTIGFQLRLEGNRIAEIAFHAIGCGFTLACGSITTDLVQGETIEKALAITGKEIRSALGGLPVSHGHCADLAANALVAALRNAIESRRTPWRKLYRK